MINLYWQETRKKFFKWLSESTNYDDQLFNDIEKDQLRLAIKQDDIDSFQRILANTNLSIDSKIRDSTFENFHRFSNEVKLIQFAIEFNAIKIFHFLIMNDAEIDDSMIWSAIFSGNYEMVHFMEQKMKEKFEDFSLCNSISCWNDELIEYVLNNYDKYDFFQKDEKDIKIEDKELLLDIMRETFYYFNFSFFESVLFPFLQKNEKFIKENINEILLTTFEDGSCYFTKEFLKSSFVDINYYSMNSKRSLLGKAIEDKNTNAVKILLSYDNINVNDKSFNDFPALIHAVGAYADIKILDLLYNHPNIDLNKRDSRYHVRAFEISISRGNFYAIKYFNDHNYKYNDNQIFPILLPYCIQSHFFLSLKMTLSYCKNHFDINDFDQLVESLINDCKDSNDSEQVKIIQKELKTDEQI